MSEPDLFGVATNKPARKRAEVPASSVGRLLGVYRRGYEQMIGETPVVYKSDGRILKLLIAQYGESLVEKRLAAFLAWDDPFVRSSGYSIPLFYRQWNRLAAFVLPARGTATRVPTPEQTLEYRRSLRR